MNPSPAKLILHIHISSIRHIELYIMLNVRRVENDRKDAKMESRRRWKREMLRMMINSMKTLWGLVRRRIRSYGVRNLRID
jgi:hypothetical protein